jgi:segregation and condensation protein A
MEMAEKIVPWWRRALQFALGGIRSGFGLFQRGAKPGELEESEPGGGVEAREPERERASEPAEAVSVAQENASKGPLQIASPPEVDDLAVEIRQGVAVGPMSEETASNPPNDASASEQSEPGEIEPVDLEQAETEIGEMDRAAAEPEKEEATPPNSITEAPAPIEKEEEGDDFRPDEALAVQREESLEEIHSVESSTESGMPEPVPTVELEVPKERLEEAEESEVAAEALEVTPAKVGGEAAAESVETTEALEPMEADEAAIEAPINEKQVEELETVESETTGIATGADVPAEERAEEVTAVEVRAEERAAAGQDAEPEAAGVEEPVIAVMIPEEKTEPHEESVDELVAAAPEIMEEARNEEMTGAQTTEAPEEAREESVPVEAAESQEESSEEPVTAAPDVMEDAGSEVVVETQVAEAAEEPAAEERSVEALHAEQEPGEPARMEGTSNPAVEGTEAKPEPGVDAIPEVESLAELVAEAVAAPAQLELIPKPQVDEKAAAKLAEQQRRRKEAEAESPFSVMVGQVYEGPLDLLLDLIRKQDIDIYDIPIAKITAQFLAYVNQLKASDVDVAGEFIYTASLLIHIKSKMLLPRTVEGPGEAPEDPRRELVERLLEHERFKNAAQMLQQKQMMEAASWSNPGYREFVDDEGTEPEIAADTVDLVKVFREILERARNRPVLDVAEDTVTVGQMIRFLGRRLMMEDKPIALRKLLSHTRSERALIAMFLALLELVRLQAVLLRQDKQFSEIFIKKHAAFETVMNEGLANARDDWR